jgi:hypothetical protein
MSITAAVDLVLRGLSLAVIAVSLLGILAILPALLHDLRPAGADRRPTF